MTAGGQDADTGLDFIPCYVVINDGLTGDMMGESDVAELMDLQNAYNRLNSDDADALKFNMFPQTVATDVKAESLEAMRISPGALVDLQTDPATMGSGQAKLDKLESSFSYSERFEARRRWAAVRPSSTSWNPPSAIPNALKRRSTAPRTICLTC